ncbi:hypothetical protein B0T25DRAFT_562671 [Lasiosphaeria hispida]|uniref:Uncharacterized protein n=1 Tax=Lasiosphaeria hispida TaxID=260671 RepID=A0AAJ0HW43_9PEZI|nr:hypothetical protein B0T25DRAFT_562671 [Lasiosphaeria hispida]
MAVPILIYAAISFAQPFDAAAAKDRLGADTVHYGSLSKAILEGIREWTVPVQDDYKPTAVEILDESGTISPGSRPRLAPAVLVGRIKEHRAPFLSVTITLPKAPLLGSGVSLTATSVFSEPAPLNERLAKQIVMVSITIEELG